jgi:putative endonuclease
VHSGPCSEPRAVRSAPAGADPRRALGRRGEALAAEHLRRRGFALLAHNARTRHGEIDLIVFDGHTLVFCEVKCRRARRGAGASDPSRQPLAGIGARKRARLRRLAAAWLADRSRPRPTARLIRFDAIGVSVDARDELLALEHLESAW